MKERAKEFKYPGVRAAMDGNTAVIMCEREASDAAGAYPITPSTQMGEYWAEAAAAGHINVSGRPLIFIEPEGEHAAAAVTAGLSMTGLRSCNFSSGQGIAYMHESLYAAVGKRLTYILNMGCRAMTKASLNVHAGHDDYHAVDDSGFFQVFGKDVQEVSDLNIIAHKIAELALNPGIVAQDGFLTTHLIESLALSERELIAEYLGSPSDIIQTPTPAQRLIFGETRRRIPELWDVDNPVMAGVVQNQDAYMQSVAAQRPFFFDHIREITEQCMEEFYQLTGRRYQRVSTYKADDADYLIVGQGSVMPSAEVVSDYLREKRGLKVGVVNITMFRPWPGDLLGSILRGKKGVVVLERTDQPLAADLPLIREVRDTVCKCLENARSNGKGKVHVDHDTYKSTNELPPLYSGAFGLGSRDLQPEGIIGAIENMLPDGKQKKFFYLSIDFVRDKAFTPKQEIYQQQILDGYPNIKELSLRGSEDPNLMPEGSVTVRFHSIGGWGAMTTGKNLAMTLFDLLGYHIKANPKYGSEKKGQPTTFYLSAAPEPIRINCEYFHVDVVLSPDPKVFNHSNPLAGLKKGGVFIIQSDHASPDEVWKEQIPVRYQRIIEKNEIKVYYLDAFKIAREIATDAELQFRMQGIAFMGAFFAASPVMSQNNMAEEALFKAIEEQLEHKFGSKGRRIVNDNMQVVRRGYTEIAEITTKSIIEAGNGSARKEALLPAMLNHQPVSAEANTDIHRYWDQTGYFYNTGKGNDNLADPFISISCIPVATGIFRDMTQIRFEHPEWNPMNCTACGKCYTVCPDSAIPGLVNTLQEVLDTAIRRVESGGRSTKHLRRVTRSIERKVRALTEEGEERANVKSYLKMALDATLAESTLGTEEKSELESELALMEEHLTDFQLSVTKPFFVLKEKEAKGSGGFLSITVDPYACKGCMECVAVCEDDALRPVQETTERVEKLRKNWDFWTALPTTNPEYIRIDDLEEGIGALETLLLDKRNYKSIVGGDGACLGCGEKTVVHLFTATVEALMQPRVKKQVEKLDKLIAEMERHVRLKLAETLDVSDDAAMQRAIERLNNRDLTLSSLSAELDGGKAKHPLDSDWLRRVSGLLSQLRDLRWRYVEGTTGRGRSSMGMINATGCTSVWGSTYPFNPYPFPWTNHLFQDSTSMAMGIYEGHMQKMADGFKAIRMAEMELEGKLNLDECDEEFRYFKWQDFTDEEWHLCPPVVAVGGDGAMFDIGFQNLSRMLMSGKPIKVLVLDTQVYSNTGGQACTSGFLGQVSDMAQYGKAQKGKEEIRKEFAYIGFAHRTAYVVQGNMANPGHLIESYIQGLLTRRPAVFTIHAPCMPEHGIGDDAAQQQSKLALESRAYPIFRYNPDNGVTVSDCLDLEGNPSPDTLWPAYALSYVDEEGNPASMDIPLTFADYAVTEARFRKHFRTAPRDSWNENMVPFAEYLEMDADEREDLVPYIWAVDAKNRLARVMVAEPMVKSTEDRANFWTMLRSLTGADKVVDVNAIEQKAKSDVVQKLTQGLVAMLGGGPVNLPVMPALMDSAGATPAQADAAAGAPASVAQAGSAATNGQEPYLDTVECTSCGECILVNPTIFGWDANKKAVITNPKGGPYKDMVKAAEKCAAKAIKPGLPFDPNEKGVDKLIKRAEKYNK